MLATHVANADTALNLNGFVLVFIMVLLRKEQSFDWILDTLVNWLPRCLPFWVNWIETIVHLDYNSYNKLIIDKMLALLWGYFKVYVDDNGM